MSVQRIVIDNFLGGLSSSRYVGNVLAGQCDPDEQSSSGWEVFHNTNDIGLLRRGSVEGTITNVSLIQGKIHWIKTYNRTLGSYIYALGQDDNLNENRLYRIDLASDTVSNASPWPFTVGTSSPNGTGLGMEYYGGYLYYASGRYLGRYNMSLTFDNSFYTFLGTKAIGTSIEHPMVQGNGKLFIGNSNFSLNTASIATYDDASVTPNALDLGKTEQFIRAIEFNNNFLYIATTNNTEDNSKVAESYLYVWDTVSSSWQQQFRFPEEDLKALKASNGKMFAFGNRGAYIFNGTNFELIYPLSGGPTPGGVSVNPSGIINWCDQNLNIFAYGSPNPSQIPPITYKPYVNDYVYNGAIQWVTRTKLYAATSTDNPKLRMYGGSGNYESATWRTPMIPFGVKARLVKLYAYFLSWPANCTVTVGWASGDGSSITTIGTINTAGDVQAEFSYDGLVADSWQITLTHTVGISGATPKFRKIVIEWEPELE